jgi:hypothetical protein
LEVPGSATTEDIRLPFGPYAGLTVEEVVALDPEHLRRMVAGEIGPPELRARAARLLLARPRSQDLRRGWGQGLASAGVVGIVVWGAYLAHVGATDSPFTAATSPPATNSFRSTPLADGWGRPTAVQAAAPTGAVRTPGSRREAPLEAAGDDDMPRESVDEARPCGQRATGSIDAERAEASPGAAAAVEFRVLGTHDTGEVTFLNSHDPYRDHFYVAIFPDDYDAFPSPPSEYFHGRCVVVQGKIELFRGTPQIVLNRPTDIVIVGD